MNPDTFIDTKDVDEEVDTRRNRRILWIISIGLAIILATLTSKAEPQVEVKGEVIATFGIVHIIKMPAPEQREIGP